MPDADRVLKALIKAGKITEREIAELGLIEPVLKKVVDILHATFCVADHDGDACPYYAEEQIVGPDDTWMQPAHVTWHRRTNNFITAMEAKAEKAVGAEGFRGAFRRATTLMKNEPEEVIIMLGVLLNRAGFWKLIGEKRPTVTSAQIGPQGVKVDDSATAIPELPVLGPGDGPAPLSTKDALTAALGSSGPKREKGQKA